MEIHIEIVLSQKIEAIVVLQVDFFEGK